MFKHIEVFTTIICLVTMTATSRPLHASEEAAPKFDQKSWMQFGQDIVSKDPSFAKVKDKSIAKARLLVSKLADEMTRRGVLPSTSFGDRVMRSVSGAKCDEIGEIVTAALRGGGFNVGDMTDIVVHKGNMDLTDVNRNHIAPGLKIDGKYYFFDLWQHGKEEDAFKDFSKDSKWNGAPQDAWMQSMRDQGYQFFKNLSDDNFYPIMQGSNLDLPSRWFDNLYKQMNADLAFGEKELSPHDAAGLLKRMSAKVTPAPDGLELEQFRRGPISYTFYTKDGKQVKHGIYTNKHANGAVWQFQVYRHGIRILERTYRSNGYAEWIHPRDSEGRMNGIQRAYHENGKIKAEIPWVNNAEEGMAKYYQSNGDFAFYIRWEKGVKKEKSYTP